MPARGEYEPKDSRKVEATKGDPGKSWREQEKPERGEYEPKDSRNVEGTATTQDGRWTDKDGKPPRGVPQDDPADAEDAVRDAKDHPDMQRTAPAAEEADEYWRKRDGDGSGNTGSSDAKYVSEAEASPGAAAADEYWRKRDGTDQPRDNRAAEKAATRLPPD